MTSDLCPSLNDILSSHRNSSHRKMSERSVLSCQTKCSSSLGQFFFSCQSVLLSTPHRESKTRCQCHSLCALSIPDDTTTFFTDDGHLLQKQKLHSWVPSSPDPFIIIIIIIIFVCRLLQTSDTGHLTLDAKRTKEAYSSSSYVFLQSNRSIDEQTLPPGEPSLASRKALTL